MNITVLCVGQIKEKYFRDAIAEYSKRLSRYCKLQVIEVADEKTKENASEAECDSKKRGRATAETYQGYGLLYHVRNWRENA